MGESGVKHHKLFSVGSCIVCPSSYVSYYPCVIFKPFFNLMYKDKNIRTKYITQHVINDKHSDNMNFQSRHVSRRLSKETKFGEKKKGHLQQLYNIICLCHNQKYWNSLKGN